MKVKDFRIERRVDGKWYCFRFGSGDDFQAVLDGLKRRVPLVDREYRLDRQHEWAVRAECALRLDGIFENWRQSVEAAEAQMPLPL